MEAWGYSQRHGSVPVAWAATLGLLLGGRIRQGVRGGTDQTTAFDRCRRRVEHLGEPPEAFSGLLDFAVGVAGHRSGFAVGRKHVRLVLAPEQVRLIGRWIEQAGALADRFRRCSGRWQCSALSTLSRVDGLIEWLRSCPDHDWFVEIDSGSTVGLDYAAGQETAYLCRSPANARRLLDAAEAADRGETTEHSLDQA